MFNSYYRSVSLILISFFLIINCSGTEEATAQYDPNTIGGEWTLEMTADGHSDKYVFAFIVKNGGEIEGYAESYRDSFKYPREAFAEIEYNHPVISFLCNPKANVRYNGKFDLENQTLTGKIQYSDGTSRDFNFERTGSAEAEDTGVYTYEGPPETGDGLMTASLSSVNMDSEKIITAVEKIRQGKYGMLNSFLLIKDGKLVLEEYFNGYKRENLFGIQSVTKSITSLLIGISIDKGYIKNINEKMSDYFPEYNDVLTGRWENIRLRHFLSMSSGLKWSQEEQDSYLDQDDYILDVLSKEPVDQPGTKFEYINANLSVFPGIIKKASGIHADEFAKEHLFKPLGITEYDWDHARQNGYPLCSGSLCLKPRDLAKIGLLMLNEGKWNGEQIISSEWIRASTEKQVDNEDYGYLWWILKRNVDGKTVKGYFANGWGSQFIIVIPQFNLVAVTTGNNMNNKKHMAPFGMLAQYILRSVQ
ncbi:MAG: serine hydrolase [bacterium]|nr:serine hydrolase [bacterium]